MLAVDRDSSILFHSYHRRLATAKQVLAKLPTIPLDQVRREQAKEERDR